MSDESSPEPPIWPPLTAPGSWDCVAVGSSVIVSLGVADGVSVGFGVGFGVVAAPMPTSADWYGPACALWFWCRLGATVSHTLNGAVDVLESNHSRYVKLTCWPGLMLLFRKKSEFG